MMFELFDSKAEVEIAQGASLPHWYQPGVTYFITFRTEDSVPASTSRTWHRRRDEWLQQHSLHPANKNWRTEFERLPEKVRREYHETSSKEFMQYLDRGFGACVLKQPEIAQVVAKSLRHFDGERYYLGDFVVMPNHVHLLACLIGETEVQSQCYSWKKYTATQINRQLNSKGRFWQEESFDHLVRSSQQFEAIQKYIANNPGHAGLKEGEYLHSKLE